jgi:hypothetical protein
MFRHICVILLSGVMACYAWSKNDVVDNWSGIDTANTAQLYAKYDTVKFSKVFKLTAGENIRVILKADDTTTARFAGDSLGIRWGYQTMCPCYNSSGVADTCVDQLIKLDSLVPAGFGSNSAVIGSIDADGVITRSNGIGDTVFCSGYVTQSKWFQPEWDVYVRFWVRGIGANKKSTAVPAVIDVQRRQYSQTRSK